MATEQLVYIEIALKNNKNEKLNIHRGLMNHRNLVSKCTCMLMDLRAERPQGFYVILLSHFRLLKLSIMN